MRQALHVAQTLGVRDRDAFDPFTPGDIANRLSPRLKLGGGRFSLSTK